MCALEGSRRCITALLPELAVHHPRQSAPLQVRAERHLGGGGGLGGRLLVFAGNRGTKPGAHAAKFAQVLLGVRAGAEGDARGRADEHRALRRLTPELFLQGLSVLRALNIPWSLRGCACAPLVRTLGGCACAPLLGALARLRLLAEFVRLLLDQISAHAAVMRGSTPARSR